MIGKKDIDLGSGNVKKLLFKLAIPSVIAQFINLLYNLVDRIYIGNMPAIGDLALTGIGISLPILAIVMAFASLFSVGGASRASIAMGRGDKETAEKIVGNSLTLLLFISIIMTVVLYIFAEPILFFFGATERTISYALDYLKIYALGTLFVQLAFGMNAYITCQGFAMKSMMTILIGAVLNIILDPIFIYGMNMGVKGAALATIISQGVSAVWVVHFLLGKKTKLKLKAKNLVVSPKIILPCIALGASPFIMQGTEAILMVCFNTSMLEYGGDLAVGVMTVLSSIMQFSLFPLMGFTQGAQPLISYNYGAKKPERVKEAFRTLFICSLIYTTVIWAFAMLFPNILIGMFNRKTELLELGIKLLRVYLAVNLLFGAQLACQQTFIALGNAKKSMFLALFRKVILLIPLIYILPAIFTADQVVAVVLAEPVTDFIAIVVTVIMFFSEFRPLMRKMEAEKAKALPDIQEQPLSTEVL